MKAYIKLMRPKHYLKNGLIFFPLVFGGLLLNGDKILTCLISFFAFSLMASVIYIINDIRDKEKDKLHEKKKHRPIASGKVSVHGAIIFGVILLAFSIGLQYLAVKTFLHPSFLYLLLYFVLNIMYSFGLKNVPLVDVTILVIGFLLRVLYGAAVIDIQISNWLYLTVISVSFYLSLGKRRNEIVKLGTDSREVLKYYNQAFLDKNMYLCLALTIVFYSLWCAGNPNSLMVWTVPLIILLCMRYSMNVEKDSLGDPVDVIFSDKALLILGFLTGVFMLILLYGRW